MYSPEAIAGFLLDERLAIHGISPEVFAQNQQLVKSLDEAAAASSDALLSVQFVGSRSNGTSDLGSDLDLVAVTFDTDEAREDVGRLVEAAQGLGIKTDSGLAAMATGAHDTIPTEATDFIYWVDTKVEQTTSLFEKGVYATPSQRLGQLTVTSMLRSFAVESMGQEQWQNIRNAYADTYLGDLDRMREKLRVRLDVEQAHVNKSISQSLMRQRHVKYGLPENMQDYHLKAENWATKNKAKLRKLPAYELYRDVLSEL